MNDLGVVRVWRRVSCGLSVVVLGLVMAGCGGDGGGEGGGDPKGGASKAPRFVSLGTAPLGGTFYNVGAAISEALNNGKELGGWRQASAESTGGSLENFRRLESSDIQIGMANSTITYFAVRGEGGFEKKHDVKTIMTMFPLVAMFVTKKDSGINTIADLKGKRVVLGPAERGSNISCVPFWKGMGLKYEDLTAEYAGMASSVGLLQDGSVAATFLGGGLQSTAISSAAATMDILLVPYGEKEREALIAKYPSFGPVVVPAETYRGQDADFNGLNVGNAHLVVRTDTDEEFVYNATKIIFEGRAKIAQTHAAGKSINEKNVARNVGTDFHPGAIRYYKELGIWKD